MQKHFDWITIHKEYLNRLKILANKHNTSLNSGYEKWEFQTGNLFWKKTVVYFDCWEDPEEITVVDNNYIKLAQKAETILKERLTKIRGKNKND